MPPPYNINQSEAQIVAKKEKNMEETPVEETVEVTEAVEETP